MPRWLTMRLSSELSLGPLTATTSMELLSATSGNITEEIQSGQDLVKVVFVASGSAFILVAVGIIIIQYRRGVRFNPHIRNPSGSSTHEENSECLSSSGRMPSIAKISHQSSSGGSFSFGKLPFQSSWKKKPKPPNKTIKDNCYLTSEGKVLCNEIIQTENGTYLFQ